MLAPHAACRRNFRNNPDAKKTPRRARRLKTAGVQGGKNRRYKAVATIMAAVDASARNTCGSVALLLNSAEIPAMHVALRGTGYSQN